MPPAPIDLTSADYWVDPYPTLRAARAAGRTTVTTGGEIVLLNADDVDTLYLDRHFTVPGVSDLARIGIFDGPFYEWRKQTLAVMEGENHARLRGFVGPAFAPRQMDRLRVIARERAHALIDARTDAGEMEVLNDFAGDLPLWSMCRFIGISDEDRQRIGGFLIGTEEGFTSPMTPERRQRVETAITAHNDYVSELIARQRAEPQDNMVGMLIAKQAEPDGPTDDELQSLIVNIIGGSVGSTRAAFANAILEFARHPEQAEIVRRDAGKVQRAVEECLRFHPPFRFGRRVVKEAGSLFGIDLKVGQSIFVPRQAVNRDPSRFDDPDKFDIMRTQRRHLSFSHGAHLCLGHAMARINLQEGLKIFLDRCADVTLVEEPVRVPFVPDEQLKSLRIRFRPVGRAVGGLPTSPGR
jgi:cytochrome P450